MEKEEKCEICGIGMYQVGEFASTLKEGEFPKMADDFHTFQCRNKQCSNFLKVITKKNEQRNT